jgi:uncharacterized protein
MIVADSSSLIALSIIDCIEIIEKIFDNIIISEEVYNEITIIDKPFSKKLKEYFEYKVVKVKNITALKLLKEEIDDGEAETIVLALESGINNILIDDLKGRKRADLSGLKVFGTLGTLLTAKKMGLINSIKKLIDKLIENDIRISKELYEYTLIKADEI